MKSDLQCTNVKYVKCEMTTVTAGWMSRNAHVYTVLDTFIQLFKRKIHK